MPITSSAPSNHDGPSKPQHPSSTSSSSSLSSSFDVFAKVDELVSKPVLGSDGAASWQAFRNGNNVDMLKSRHRTSAAPRAPLKKADKLGTGLTSWEEERAHEERIRQAAGHANAGAGYTVFKKKNDGAEEAVERKRQAQIRARTRPDDQEYFIPSKAFQGWKFDYIFTTRPDRGGTGYYWDGMDSIKKLEGTLPLPVEEHCKAETPGQIDGSSSSVKSREEEPTTTNPKKKKRKKDKGPVIVHDPNNPLEQVQAILARRNQQLMGMMASPASIPDPTLPDGWETATDPASGTLYYFHRETGERSWEKPHRTSPATEETLPEGWNAAQDSASGKIYYYNSTTGETKWEKPQRT